ncbi:uncharacterized protein LOC110706991 [Chenopodium quinoa]|uniref:uncharacterized protein LOC110706991 n=1 Tax=Chenopodium quinoa TaxID=63459 RepID=UPI000B782C9E|nr:uncharacterized protein LOC110706991 [Chenopodium quinoa]
MWIDIPSDLLINGGANPIVTLVEEVYPEILDKHMDPRYLQQRAILATKNETVDKINGHILEIIQGEERIYKSADRICQATRGRRNVESLYPTEFLNTLQFPGVSNHEIHLKVGCPILLLRNISQRDGLCNGTRLIVTRLQNRVIEAQIVTGTNAGDLVCIPRVEMS